MLSYNKVTANDILTSMEFEDHHIQKAFEIYKMQFGGSYDINLMTELISRLQRKELERESKNSSNQYNNTETKHNVYEEQYDEFQKLLSPIPEQLSSDSIDNMEISESNSNQSSQPHKQEKMFYGTEYEVKCNQTFAYYTGYVIDLDEKQQTLKISYSWKQDENVPINDVRSLPTHINQTWKPKNGERIEVKAKAEDDEPYGWWDCTVKHIEDNFCIVSFAGCENKNVEIKITNNTMRPYNSQNTFDDIGHTIIRELVDIPNERIPSDENNLIIEQSELKKIAIHLKLIHLNYCPFEQKLLLIGTKQQIFDAKMLLNYDWQLKKIYDNQVENELQLQEEYYELKQCVDIKFTFNIGVNDKNIEIANQLSGVKYININYLNNTTVECHIFANDENTAHEAANILQENKWKKKYDFLNYEYQINKQVIDNIMDIWKHEIKVLIENEEINEMDEEEKHLMLKNNYQVIMSQKTELAQRLVYETREYDLLRFKFNEKNIKCDELLRQVENLLDEKNESEQKMNEFRKKIELFEGKRNCLKMLQMEELDELESKLFDAIKHVQQARKSLQQNKYKCIICLINPKNVSLNGCIHVVLCDICETKLQQKTCPICRVPYDSIKKLKF